MNRSVSIKHFMEKQAVKNYWYWFTHKRSKMINQHTNNSQWELAGIRIRVQLHRLGLVNVLKSIWLMLIDADCCWLMLIDADWCWLMLIDADWCWLMLIDAQIRLTRFSFDRAYFPSFSSHFVHPKPKHDFCLKFVWKHCFIFAIKKLPRPSNHVFQFSGEN